MMITHSYSRVPPYRPFAFLLVAITLTTLSASSFPQEFIRIASFNIAEFGEGNHPETRDLETIASLLVDNDLDLIAIQEVGVKETGAKQVYKLADKMNCALSSDTPRYVAAVTPQSGDERCAFIYRFPIVQGDDLLWLDEDKDPSNPAAGGTTYFRIPVAVSFSAGNFDFFLVSVHLTWGKLDRREGEISALKSFLRDDSGDEKDWIVLGDMNRYGKYKKSDRKAFDRLLRGNWKRTYRFPLLEAITNPDDMKIWRAPTDQTSTTIAQSKNIYDQFVITSGAYREFASEDPRLGENVGIIAFDREEPYASISDHNDIKYRISDHRPIWARFRIDLPDDD